MTTQTITDTHDAMNGVNVTGLRAAIDTFENDPALARCRFRARNRWVDGAHNRTTIQDFDALGATDRSRGAPFVHDADEPPALFGRNLGANPVEFVLSALAGCVTTTLVYYAAIQGIELTSVESELEADLDLRGLLGVSDEVRNGFQNVRVTFHIASPEPRARIEELVATARRHSPTADIVSNPVPVTLELAD